MRHCDFVHKTVRSSDVRQMRINVTYQENLRREMCMASCSFLCVFSGKLIKCVTLFLSQFCYLLHRSMLSLLSYSFHTSTVSQSDTGRHHLNNNKKDIKSLSGQNDLNLICVRRTKTVGKREDKRSY